MGIRLILSFTCAILAVAPSSFASGSGSEGRFLVDYSPYPGSHGWEGFDQVILDPSAKVTLPAPRDGSPTVLAYLSLVEIPSHATYENEAKEAGLILEHLTNEVWQSAMADLLKPGWPEFVVKRLAAPALQRGFQGFFLDTADSIHRLPGADRPATLAKYEGQVAAIIVKLREAFPQAPIVLNRGFAVIDQLPAGTLSGVLIESLFQTYDHATKSYTAVRASDTEALTALIAKLQARGLPVSVIDYVDPVRPELAAATARRIQSLGASALVTTPELQGIVLAPASAVARQLFVLYGADPALTIGDPKFVPDVDIARHFQSVLEWMGYELRWHSVADGRPKDLSPEHYAGILLEGAMVLSPTDEAWYVEWLLRQREKGLKLFFSGAIPFNHSLARKKLLAALGIGGSGHLVRGVTDLEIAAKDGMFDFEVSVQPTARGFLDLTAPAEARPLLQIVAKDSRGRAVRFDAAFAADWGAAVFDPYWRFQPYMKDTLSYFDPYQLLATVWPVGAFPAPDVTTRAGLRLFWAHVDGDAFSTLSTTRRDTTCAEVLCDRIFKRYPLPTTVSVIEAEIRAIQETQNPEDSPRLEAAAREIFRLPNIEAASHGFSHPFVWSTRDVGEEDTYNERHLHLKVAHRFDEIDPRREIEGSVKYIESQLLPPGKKVNAMLWTGNCRPFPEALRICRELGIEAMNGGFTIYSPRHPQNAAIAPRVTWWGDELQVYAANQNEFVYTDDWSGPLFGGFDQVIDSFEMLGSPRRIKPVNVYYHFYSGVFPGSLTAIERVYDWVMAQPLHPVTTSEAVRITRDAVQTRLAQTGPNRWLIVNDGKLTTFRLPKSLGYPDLAASTNITGFNDAGSERYFETNGARFAELVLSPQPPQRLFLVSSAAPIEFQGLEPSHCAFRIAGWKPSELVFGGVEPGSKWTLQFSELSKSAVFRDLQADASGRLTFTLPKSTVASLAPANRSSAR